MLQGLRDGLGFRVAMTLAVLGALCLVAPPAVLAFGHGDKALHCLSNADRMEHGMHGGAAQDHHGDHGSLPDKAPGCCGLYCLSALTLNAAPALEAHEVALPLALPALALPAGRVPDRLDRPPISLISV